MDFRIAATIFVVSSSVAWCVPKEINGMVVVPAGSFDMGYSGSKTSFMRTCPLHHVYVDSFLMDKHEVTQGAYAALIGENPVSQRRDRFRRHAFYESIVVDPNCPVVYVSWYDAVRYCNARSRAEGLELCYDISTWDCDFSKTGYRLPTEAEWEYACRAGTTTKYFFGDDANDAPAFVNCFMEWKAWITEMADAEEPRWDKPLPRMLPAGSKRPNPWGLYDMLGNVGEWCNDWYDENYYSQSPPRNPRGPVQGCDKVLRGGSFSGWLWRRSKRGGEYPSGKQSLSFTRGFRCVRRFVAGESRVPGAASPEDVGHK